MEFTRPVQFIAAGATERLKDWCMAVYLRSEMMSHHVVACTCRGHRDPCMNKVLNHEEGK